MLLTLKPVSSQFNHLLRDHVILNQTWTPPILTFVQDSCQKSSLCLWISWSNLLEIAVVAFSELYNFGRQIHAKTVFKDEFIATHDRVVLKPFFYFLGCEFATSTRKRFNAFNCVFGLIHLVWHVNRIILFLAPPSFLALFVCWQNPS